MAATIDTLDRAFGPLALALDPRSITRGPHPPRETPSVYVAFRPAGMPDQDRERLRALDSSTGLGSSGSVLTCERAELEQAAVDCASAAVLLAAHDHGSAPVEPLEMWGVVNVTPDSFSDGGRFTDASAAVAHGERMAAEGAAVIDVGGESTRPGAASVTESEELQRVVPVIEALAERGLRVSVDTRKAPVARAALDAGARIVNDISAGTSDPLLLELVAERGVELVLMHMQGTPETMQAQPTYEDVVADVTRFLRERIAACLKVGIAAHRIVVDPGIGFGKRLDHNLALIRRLGELRSLGRPLLLGVSRKSFIAQVTGRSDRPLHRVGGSAAAVAACVLGGASKLRVHDVAVMTEAAQVAQALHT